MNNLRRPVKMDRLLIEDVGDGYGAGAAQDMFGLEIELEGKKIITEAQAIIKWWTKHNDGSLRANKPGSQAIEYVFSKPLNMEDTKIALKALMDHLNSSGVTVFPSYRTSIHVHVNCLNETLRTIVNFITLAVIFDELLVSLNGDTRIANNFCLRTKDAEGQLEDIIQSIQTYGSLGNISPHHRYSSTNLASLNKFGTIEFRSLECTTDYNRVMAWIEVVQGLKAAARQYSNPREIIDKFSRRGPLGFMISHLGAQAGKYSNVQGAHEMLRNGMRLAQDFAFCSEWKAPTAEELKEASRPRRRSAKEQADAEMYAIVQGYAGAHPAAPQVGNAFYNPFMAGQAAPQQAQPAPPQDPWTVDFAAEPDDDEEVQPELPDYDPVEDEDDF